MTTAEREYTYFQNGHDGTFDVIAIISPDDEIIARLYYWEEPDTDEGQRVRESARIICEQLNRWPEPDYSEMAEKGEPTKTVPKSDE
jgi:hypothetical protein